MDQGGEFQTGQRQFATRCRQLIAGLFQLGQGGFRRRFAEYGQRPGNVMRAQHIHRRIEVGGRIIFAEAGQLSQRLRCREPAGQIIEHRRAERIVDHRVQLMSPQVLAQLAVAFLARSVFPYLADQHGVRPRPLQFAVHLLDKLARQFVDHVQPPTGGAFIQPVLDHTVFAAVDEPAVGRFHFVDVRQGGHAPPAIVLVRVLAEPVPGEIRRLPGTDRTLEVRTVHAVMAEHAVQNDPDTDCRRCGLQAGETLVAAELGIDVLVIASVVLMIGHRLKNRVQVQDADAEAFQVGQLVNDAVQRAAKEIVSGKVAGLRVFGVKRPVAPVRMIQGLRRQLRQRRRRIAPIKAVRDDLIHDAVRVPVWHPGLCCIDGDLPVGGHGLVLGPGAAQAIGGRAESQRMVRVTDNEMIPKQPRLFRCAQLKFIGKPVRCALDRRKPRRLQDLFA